MQLHWRIRFVLRKIRHFWQWAPIIWRDEDWDSAYLFEIMRFKIAKLRVDMQKANRHTTMEHDIKQMKIAEELLRRHGFSEFYHDNNFNWNYQGLCTCVETTFKDCWELSDKPGYSQFVNPFCSWCKNRTVIKQSAKKEDEDFAILWEVMQKHSRRWWN